MASGCKNTPLFYALCHHKLYNKRPTVKTACKPLHMTCQGKQTQIWLYTFSFLWRFLVVKIYCCFTHNFLIKQAEKPMWWRWKLELILFFLSFLPWNIWLLTIYSVSLYNILFLNTLQYSLSLSAVFPLQLVNVPVTVAVDKRPYDVSERESKYCLVAKNIH